MRQKPKSFGPKKVAGYRLIILFIRLIDHVSKFAVVNSINIGERIVPFEHTG
jgi:hypothetical protein